MAEAEDSARCLCVGVAGSEGACVCVCGASRIIDRSQDGCTILLAHPYTRVCN